MSVRWYTTVVDCQDIAAQSRFWTEALDWRIVHAGDDEVLAVPAIALTEVGAGLPVEARGPGLLFIKVPDGKTVKNRLHFDLAPREADDQAAEVARLEALGATRVDVGQAADSRWVVLADPEGNEFCVLSPRDS
jgi:catechol 2,3-dioxygenase-like lactoylglutathione lyase family enzyme